MNAVSSAEMTLVPISQIVVGIRRREKLGRIAVLAKSIAEHGLIHPILLRGDTLVAGHRRLEACRSLNWRTIPARQVERMSDDELRAVEVDENTARENLSDFGSKARLAQIRRPKPPSRRGEAGAGPKRFRHDGKNPRGLPAGGRRNPAAYHVADGTGISRAGQHRVERRVAGVPVHATSRVVAASSSARAICDWVARDRPAVNCRLLDREGIPPTKALKC
jgi:hypothetical protein